MWSLDHVGLLTYAHPQRKHARRVTVEGLSVGIFKKRPEVVIDLRESARPPKRIFFEFGFPTRCPACNERGYLDHIDPFKRIQFEHCPSCFAKWEHAESEFFELNADRPVTA